VVTSIEKSPQYPADNAILTCVFAYAVSVNARIELGDVWMTNLRGNRADYFRKWFRGRNAKSFDRNFFVAIASSFFILHQLRLPLG
jgi:hypothetical protein